jgi:hypothetical protein
LLNFPKFNGRTAECIVAEIGVDMSVFSTAKELASWAAPATARSASASMATATCSACGFRRPGREVLDADPHRSQAARRADILIACVDGLKGFPRRSTRSSQHVQSCMVHLIRHSLRYVPRREREQVARDLKAIYTAIDADAALLELERFDEKWGERFAVITHAWQTAREHVTSFLAFAAQLRRVICTTNVIRPAAG